MLELYDDIFPYLLGALLAATAIYPARHMPPNRERQFFTVIMAVVAVGFLGFPAASGDLAGFAYELGAAATLAVLIALAVVASPAFLAFAFFLHGAWDLAHLLGYVPVDKPVWVVELCVPYDWLVAAYIAARVREW